MRRAARALVARRTESFESRHDAATSRARLQRTLQHARLASDPNLQLAWREAGGKTLLDATFLPSPRTQWVLRGLSIALVALLACTAWILAQPGESAARFLVPLFAVLTLLALPFVTLAMSSAREARESRILRAIRTALKDEDEAFPPPQKWADED